MTNDKEDAAILHAIAADAGLPFVPTQWEAVIERLDYIALLLEELIVAVAPSPLSFRWEGGDDEEAMSA